MIIDAIEIPTRILDTADVAVPLALEVPRTFKHVSLILRRGNIVSVGTNNHRTHPLAKKYGYRFDEVHSELDALLRYKGSKNNLTLVNYRINNQGEFRMSKPCSLCLPWCSAIFDKIYYSTPNGIRLL